MENSKSIVKLPTKREIKNQARDLGLDLTKKQIINIQNHLYRIAQAAAYNELGDMGYTDFIEWGNTKWE
jgi:hypothetical protein